MKYEYDNVVLGGSLEAVNLAFTEGYPIIYKELEKPFERDTIVDENSKDMIERMVFLLTLANLNLFANKIESYRKEGNSIFVSGRRPWTEEVKAKTIHDFTNIEVKAFKVVDYISVRSCGPHAFKEINDVHSDFVKQIIFYPSQRVNESKTWEINKKPKLTYSEITKDIKAISYLTEQQLNDEEYSYIYAHLKIKQMLKENGIHGKKTDHGRFKLIRLEFTKREIYKEDRGNLAVLKMESKHPYIKDLLYYLNGSRKKFEAKQAKFAKFSYGRYNSG